MELEPASENRVRSDQDRRPRLAMPLPVWLVAVADVRLPAPLGLEREMDMLYQDVLQMERLATAGPLVYRSDNALLRFDLVPDRIPRDDYRATRIEVPSLFAVKRTLESLEIDHERLKGIVPGQDVLLLRDPAGNWLELIERRELG